MEKPARSLWTRRRVILSGAAVGAAAVLRPPLAFAFDSTDTMPIAPGWVSADGTGLNYRIDGYAKVTGAKLYPRDIRGKDMAGWPEETRHAMLLMVPEARKIFKGIDLGSLGDDLQPDTIVQAADLDAAGVAATGFFETDLFCRPETVPLYLGQPAALLIYSDLGKFSQARLALIANRDVFVFGDTADAYSTDPYGSNRFTRVEGAGPVGPDTFSPVKNGWIGPMRYQKNDIPVWTPPAEQGSTEAEGSFYGEQIRNRLVDGTSGKVYKQHFETQSIDPYFMEPENGLAWFDAASGRLSMVLGVQSPLAILQAVQGLVANADADHTVGEIDAHFAYIGGGFGGKDHTIVPLYVAVAALFGDGKPVRLALNRYEQFQFGLKRHSFVMDTQLGVETESGKFTALACDMVADGGGLANFSVSVADVAATAISSIYYMPESDITTVAKQSIGVTAGSMRGYGTFQTMTAMEVLVDEVARDLGRDPIELRRINAMKTGELNLTGNTASGALRTPELLDALEASDLWKNRATAKADYEAQHPGLRYGVGVACVMKDYGTGADNTTGMVILGADGKITCACDAVEMGTGISTSAARRVGYYLGRNADTMQMAAEAIRDPLQLVTSGDPWGISQQDQDNAAANPRWTPSIAGPSSASIGAAVSTHGPAWAAWVILRFGLWPAAQSIWSEGVLGGQMAGEFVTFADLRWVDGALTGNGMTPIPLADLAARAHRDGLVTAATVHGFNRWSWSTADFAIAGETFTAPIDGLAIRTGDGTDWQLLDRSRVQFPPASFERIGVNYYAGCAAVAAIGVDPTTGEVTVEAVHQVLECGTPLVQEIVSGVGQGGIVMGLGHALTEYLPLYDDGPGGGDWNLNRYRLQMASDVPVWKITMDVLPPLSETDPPKGMGEVVMIPVVPAVINAIYDAVGVRISTLPATPEKILEAM